MKAYPVPNTVRLLGGYRVLTWDYEDGRGMNKFVWNVTLHGPILGRIITF